MKAAVCTRYGPPEVLQVRDVDDPVPGRNDVVVRIRAAAVTASDVFIRSAIPSGRLVMRLLLRIFVGFTRPRRPILGAVLAGEIESIGKKVTRFRVGDRVWAFTFLRFGCYAQRVRLAETMKLLVPLPTNLTDEEAAAIPYGGLVALCFLRRARIQRGDQVLVYGASGAIGTAATQLAKHFGATVTAVCSTVNVELVRALGADAVLDYTKELMPLTTRYDVVFDAVGRAKTSPMKEALAHALTREGRFISVDDRTPKFERADLEWLGELAEAGTLRPVIDRRYVLEEIADAHEYVGQGHKKGNVVITLGD